MRNNRKTLRRSIFTIALISLYSTLFSSAHSFAEPTSLDVITTINGSISPKSVRSSNDGLVSAHNMMYNHSITFYDAKTMALVATTKDSVRLSDFGQSQYSGTYRGAPVEGSFSPDGRYLYVTNYAMYGKGFTREGTDICKPSDKYDRSYLYRIARDTKEIDAVIKVGIVPKVVEVTPDNEYVLVTNWCSYDLTIISTDDLKVVKTIAIGAYPRGIAISNDSKFAYVAQMGGAVVHRIELDTFNRTTLPVGVNPRAIVLSPDNQTLYATLNSSGKVVAFDFAKNKVVHSVTTGKAARSLAISPDGSSLYVVNFKSNTVSKIDTSTFKILKSKKICNEPIGITYEALQNRVWVACYKGQIKVIAP